MSTFDERCAHLLPPDDHIQFPSLSIDEPCLILVAAMNAVQSPCPDCRQPTERLHGHSLRTLADLPWATAPIALRFIVRRFRCGACACPRQTLTAQLPSVAPRYARTTTRLTTTQVHTGFALGGAAGARPLARQGLPGSRNTLLRRVRNLSLSEGPAAEIIGRDDWAWRKGHRDGPLVVALKRGCPIDVLEARAAETVAAWLRDHPDVQIVARDRAAAYAAGMRQGAPEATQVADRLHLLTHLASALQAVFSAPHRELAQLPHVAHDELPAREDDAVTVPTAPAVPMTHAQQQSARHRAKRVAEDEQAQAFRQQGWTIKAIAAHLGRHHRTVKKYLDASTLPARPPRRRPPSLLAPSKTYLCERWHAGWHSVKELLHEMHARGFPGKYSVVAHYVSRVRPPAGRITRRRKVAASATTTAVDKPLTPSRATGLVMRREATLDDDDKPQRARLQAQEGAIAEAITLTKDCAELVRQRQPDQLETWLERATASGLNALKSLANG